AMWLTNKLLKGTSSNGAVALVPDCAMWTVRPSALTAANRGPIAALAVRWRFAVPLPVPDPLVICTNGWLDSDNQAQAVLGVSVNVPSPALEEIVCGDAVTLPVHWD